MKLVVYALTSRAVGRVAGRGVSGERLRAVRAGTLAAIVGDIVRSPAPSPARLRHYVSLLDRLAARHPALLPVRFGTVMEGQDELEEILLARQKALGSRLAQVRGRAQMIVRVIVAPTLADSSRSRDAAKVRPTGRQYLADRARRQSAANVPGFAALARAVAPWVRDERVERRGHVVTIYHLIPRTAARRYAAVLDAAGRAAGTRLTVSGPWPAHAFADNW